MADDGWRLGHRPGLDGLRGVAVLLVLALHWWPHTFRGGDLGVVLFFVLSGFLITRLILEEIWTTNGFDVRGFYGRRFRRLMPSSLLLTALCIGTPGVLWVLLYGANYGRMLGPLLGSPLEHTWSLAIEEQFYVVWPPLVAVVLSRIRRPCAVLSVGIVLVLLNRLSHPEWGDPRLTLGLDVRADALLLGGLIAFSAGTRMCQRGWVLVAAASAPCFAWVMLTAPPMTGFGFTLTALGWGAVVIWATTSTGWICHPTLRWFGRLSYSLYLWHYPVTWALREGSLFNTAWHTTVLAIPLSFGLSLVSYHHVEDRFRRRRSESGETMSASRTDEPEPRPVAPPTP